MSKINAILYLKDLKLTDNYDLIASTENTSESLQQTNEKKNKNSGFYILPFNDEPEDMMKAIQGKLEKNGSDLKLVKAGDIFDSSYKGNIIKEIEIKDKIRRSNVIFADISEQNANVYYEIGTATALDKNIITICNKDKFNSEDEYKGKLPLDISLNRTIFYKQGYITELQAVQTIVTEIESIINSKSVRIG